MCVCVYTERDREINCDKLLTTGASRWRVNSVHYTLKFSVVLTLFNKKQWNTSTKKVGKNETHFRSIFIKFFVSQKVKFHLYKRLQLCRKLEHLTTGLATILLVKRVKDKQ